MADKMSKWRLRTTCQSGAGWIWLLMALVLVSLAASAQTPVTAVQTLTGFAPAPAPAPTSAPAPAPAQQGDPLGRDTPRGAVLGFLAATASGDYERAGQFLGGTGRDSSRDELVDQLTYVLNGAKLVGMSDKQEGTSAPGESKGVEKIGVIPTADGPLELDLVRTKEGGNWVWVFAPQTLRNIPAAYEFLSESSVSRHLPPVLSRPMWLFVPLWKYLAILGSFLLAFAGIHFVRPYLIQLITRAFTKESVSDRLRLSKRLSRPIVTILWLIVTIVLVHAFSLPLLARERWFTIVSRTGVAVIAWLFLTVINVFALVYRLRADRNDRVEMTAVVRLAQRTVSFLCIFFGLVIILRLAGYDVTAFLTGLGVGGIAIALAAQKTLENLFGGVSIILDSPIHVGDECRVGGVIGTVVDIGLRSTRLRTLERTIMTVPNGQLATMTLDNLTMRDTIRFVHVLKVQTKNGTRRLEGVLETLRGVLLAEPTVDPSSCRVRLIKVEAQTSDVELVCLVKTRDGNEFLSVQEHLLLKCLRAIDEQESALSMPSSVVYLADNRIDAADAQDSKAQA